MKKTISALTAAAVFTVFATAFAETPLSEQAPAQMPAPTQEMTPPPAQAPRPRRMQRSWQARSKRPGRLVP